MKQLRGALLPLFFAIILTACGWNAKVDTASWQYHAFEDIGIAMLLPEDMEEYPSSDAVYHGSGEELQLTVTALDELFADTEKLAASVSRAARTIPASPMSRGTSAMWASTLPVRSARAASRWRSIWTERMDAPGSLCAVAPDSDWITLPAPNGTGDGAGRECGVIVFE